MEKKNYWPLRKHLGTSEIREIAEAHNVTPQAARDVLHGLYKNDAIVKDFLARVAKAIKESEKIDNLIKKA